MSRKTAEQRRERAEAQELEEAWARDLRTEKLHRFKCRFPIDGEWTDGQLEDLFRFFEEGARLD